jgi:hypothetical protein
MLAADRSDASMRTLGVCALADGDHIPKRFTVIPIYALAAQDALAPPPKGAYPGLSSPCRDCYLGGSPPCDHRGFFLLRQPSLLQTAIDRTRK